jgi:hypothetical protein
MMPDFPIPPVSPSLVSLVIHGHFYQPPRENPWLEEVEIEPTAAPFHDWNERIERECYHPVVTARVLSHDGRFAEIINTLSWISFNFGPTLLTWMEAAAPQTYAAIQKADRESTIRLGHGNAIAHPYHHVILPLSTRRDKITEVRWGIADFRRRFGREPEGMWLPETAVDDETLDVLAAEGIQFTILAPHQASPLPPNGLAGRYRTKNGRFISVFFYDGELAHGVAFGELIRDAGLWSARLKSKAASQNGGLIAIATDGETYGHHHKFGEMALARVIHEFGSQQMPGFIRLENFASFLARNPAAHDVDLVAPSSWSCAHGVERWRSDCGCKIAPDQPTQQQWRAALRDALDWLAGEIHPIYERHAKPLVDNVWSARDGYDPSGLHQGTASHHRIRELLELERHAMLIYTSCAWFFDDLAGLEPAQVLKYAARAIELTGSDAPRIEAEFLRRLALAQSNDPSAGTGRDLYLARAKPTVPIEARLAAGLAFLVAAGLPVSAGKARAFDMSLLATSEDAYDVRLVHCRTGLEHRFHVALLGDELEVSLAEPASLDSPLSWRIKQAELWDRHRQLARDSRRDQLADKVLSSIERQALASGAIDLGKAARGCLIRAIDQLGQDGTGPLNQALDAIDLLVLLELPIPFDAQIAYARAAATMDATKRADLVPLAHRLGFESVNPIQE